MEKSKKAPGPDGVTLVCLKSCADQLAPTSTDQVPSCFKCSTINPILNKSKITGLNDYRPVALMSVVMKVIWKTDVGHLKDITGPQDLLQFTYRANRSVDGAVNMGLHYVLQHLDRPGAYVRILFVDFSSAFNDRICSDPTELPHILQQQEVLASKGGFHSCGEKQKKTNWEKERYSLFLKVYRSVTVRWGRRNEDTFKQCNL